MKTNKKEVNDGQWKCLDCRIRFETKEDPMVIESWHSFNYTCKHGNKQFKMYTAWIRCPNDIQPKTFLKNLCYKQHRVMTTKYDACNCEDYRPKIIRQRSGISDSDILDRQKK